MLDQPEPFADNWTYLRAELAWLDRVLSMAVAKQRQDSKAIDRVARTPGDRATSHWWQGLINLDSEAYYDSPANRPQHRVETTAKPSFQQQLSAKIQASQQSGLVLGLPALCHRLHLNSFEKNLLLMALAPEVNRRYGRLYNYLQDTTQPGATGLPTVDLILRILCRNDGEWRAARRSLTPAAPLMQFPILDMPQARPESLLTRTIKLADAVVNYLLAEVPSPEGLEQILTRVEGPPIPSTNPVGLSQNRRSLPARSIPQSAAIQQLEVWMPPIASVPNPTIADSPLVLPAQLTHQVQHLCDRFQVLPTVAKPTGDLDATIHGTVSLWVGPVGTGKTTAARAIAQTLQLPLFFADLKLIDPRDYETLLQEICDRQPYLVLLRSAQALLHRTAPISETALQQFLHRRRRDRAITLLTATSRQSLKAKWQPHLHPVLEFPKPTIHQRQQLWAQAFATDLPLAPDIDWQALAQIKLTGGEIAAIAHEASLYAAISDPTAPVTLHHLRQALAHFGKG
jgi:hypothetical protein